MSDNESNSQPMEQVLGVKTFLTWNPPTKPVTVGNITVAEGNGVVLSRRSTTSSSQSPWPTIRLEYDVLEQNELSRWVLFHTFITDNPWTLPSYMRTINGVLQWLDKPLGQQRDYSDFVNVVYRRDHEGVKLTEKLSYEALFHEFQLIDESQIGMVKNLLLDLKPSSEGWSNGEMADYSYWRMVIDFSIVDAIIGLQINCTNVIDCPACKKSGMAHYPKSAKSFTLSRLVEITGDEEKANHYMKIIWTVRESIRHKTAHESAYPEARPFSELQHGDNEFSIDMIIKSFKEDGHALSALEQNMHEVTRILLLDNILRTKIFPEIRPYIIRSGGMSWAEYQELLSKVAEEGRD